ncbi:MAG: asparagine synthase (glutamine-hydrolyzing) [Acidimicrobiales bacterium]
MCGVVGMIRYGHRERGLDPDEVLAIRDAMTARGPDGAGVWFSDDRKVALAHRRLAIIGLGEQGAQPMMLHNRCNGAGGSLILALNGEIYNYKELRQCLEDRGHRIRTQTDTEILLHLYEEFGPQCVEHLRGMYAFVLYDDQSRAMLLARDPLGIKPLYLADDGDTIRVASQASALLTSASVSKETNEAALAGLLVFGYIPEPLTAWSAIKAIPSGTAIMIQRDGSKVIRRFFSLSEEISRAEQMAPPVAIDAVLREALLDSLNAHMVSDVEVGVFLSSGIDSSTVLGLAAEQRKSLHAITVGFEEFAGSSDDEVPLARIVAETYGARHSIDLVSRENFSCWLPEMLADMDQPTIEGLNSWLVARATAGQGLKVALSGLGSDEFLGGYSNFVSVPKWHHLFKIPATSPSLGRASRRILAPMLRSYKPQAAGLIEYGDSLAHVWLLFRCVNTPWQLARVLGRDRAKSALASLNIESIFGEALLTTPKTDTGVVAALEGGLYMRNQLLRDSDWAGMAHSLEIRVPFVDSVCLPVLIQALTHCGSPPQAKQSLGRAPIPKLPTEVLSRAKTGFSIPMQERALGHPDFGQWRNIPDLTNPRCSWTRRWSYVIACQFGMV